MSFWEYTPQELAAALLELGSGLDAVVVEVQHQDGTVVERSLMGLQVAIDGDLDRTGAYRWLKIVARPEATMPDHITVTPSPFMREVIGAALADDHARVNELMSRPEPPASAPQG